MKVTVITISDRASRGIYEDLSGPKIVEILKEQIENVKIERVIVPDEKPEILKALQNANANFIITTGGTGISERDVTPEICAEFCDKELPGIAEILRAESYKETPMAMLSRGYAGMKNKTIIVNFPGSVKAVTLCTKVIIPMMKHAIKMFQGEGH
ncbi:MAG: MogA/MoaB family molybdenum cofactor biosynthesis protein [Candidatus Cloacimonetes bacterium]|jgi:molybdopterin adenylyltransferase|nr:MogA/MoaB family molybdenum cofactor biosynthesis protein [Candidatus Cloacimonadota bacterium]MBT6994382.1 MogA/MoaB family molybdenum cofactor biosynthesis protein [Candidatus Cloacimonadota bacterium]MBT7468987.1 MogA/MoaB family molybdenum cofactor biosynthesis protein [Candidatus Cloacimonadota bacterium]